MPTLSWLSRDDDLRAASRVPYRLLDMRQQLLDRMGSSGKD